MTNTCHQWAQKGQDETFRKAGKGKIMQGFTCQGVSLKATLKNSELFKVVFA